MKSYLAIYEDGTLSHYLETLGEGLLEACDDGIFQVIDISDPSNPLDYYKGKWSPVERKEA